MKKFIILSVLSFFLLGFQKSDGGKIPSAVVKNLSGAAVNTSTFANKGKPVVISFWATWCKPCKKELDALQAHYSELKSKTGVRIIAVSIDDTRSSAKVLTDVKAKGWEFDVFIDDKQDFKNAMGVNNVPHTFLIDGQGKIAWSHNSYTEGDEKILFENIQKLAKGEKVSH